MTLQLDFRIAENPFLTIPSIRESNLAEPLDPVKLYGITAVTSLENALSMLLESTEVTT